jgi:hypothetical protein
MAGPHGRGSPAATPYEDATMTWKRPTIRDHIEQIMLNAIRFRDGAVQLEGEAGRKLAAEDRRWLLNYIDRHCGRESA